MRKFTATIVLLISGLFSGYATASDEHPQVLLETSHGNILLELDAKAAPETVANFVQYVKDDFYDGTVFHRIIKGFMVQGGGMNTSYAQKKTRDPIKNESKNGLKNVRGSVAMARTNAPHSATAQFFINTVDNSFLNYGDPRSRGWGYAVFGMVIEGMDVVDKIEAEKTSRGDQPVRLVVINKASLVKTETEETSDNEKSE